MVGLEDLRVLFQPECFYDSMLDPPSSMEIMGKGKKCKASYLLRVASA